MSGLRETEAGKAPAWRGIPVAIKARTMLLANSAIAVLLDLVESNLGALTLVSAGDRHRLRELQRCRDALKDALRDAVAANIASEPTITGGRAEAQDQETERVSEPV